MTGVQNKTVLLTGASGSIGSEVARRLGARGARLAISGRREEALVALAGEIEAAGGHAPAVATADLAQSGDARRLAAEVAEHLGAVDVLINNAAIPMHGPVWVAGDAEGARAVFETNLWSPLALVAAVVPGMLERGGGDIVNITSIAGCVPVARFGIYAASKAALTMATQTMQLELAPRGVRVVEIVFGMIDTRATPGGQSPGPPRPQSRRSLGNVGTAAATIVSAAEGELEGVVTYPRALGLARRFPALASRFARAAAGQSGSQL